MAVVAPPSLVDRIRERYMDDDDEAGGDVMIQSFLSSSPKKLSGERARLQLVVLNHKSIHSIGDVPQFANLVRGVHEVDLAWNKISNWKEVSTMLKHLPQLRIFNLSHNNLESDLGDVEIPHCPHLDTLILNGTNLSLDCIRKVARQMPVLHELHLSQNNFDPDYFDSESAGPSGEGKENGAISDSVSLIHLNRCRISRWSDALKMLSLFPKRETVFLCENPIREIRDKKQESEPPYSSIRMINLSKTGISDWTSIDHIEHWPRLVDLRINNIPLLDEYTEEEKLHLVVGRLDKLELLNGSSITKEQRECSERFFIRYYEEKEERPKKYDALLAKHGQLEKLVKVDLSPKSHVTVRVKCEETAFDQEMDLKVTKTVGQLMRQIEEPVGVAYDRMRLFYFQTYNEEDETNDCSELRYPKQLLHNLHVDDGAMFLVTSKIIPSRKRAQTKSTSSNSESN
ncbi:coel-1 [Pristionchus pacificus]|uniref:Coel-1 n=1 Tax=Pristionchus pacificus TaxID=54126 RepID=A0A2A6B2Q3_PRIPA|nr:coel-1 [Pristionchus pacificus]|eukprot:PDM60155.1 coel-1 [Pristionchus pacificus]